MIRELPVLQTLRRQVPVTNLMVYLTEECNLRCTYCFVHKKPRHMSVENALKSLHFLLSPEVSADAEEVKLNFFGGEPFLQLPLMEAVWAEWQRIRADFAGKRLQLAATTNGTVVGPRVEKLLRETGMILLVSLDGDAQSNNDRPFVSGRPSYSVVAKNLPKLVEWSRSVTARVTFHPGSYDLVASSRHALELGAPSVLLAPVVEADWRGHEEALERRYLELADWMISEIQQGRLPNLVYTWEALRWWHELRPQNRRPGRPCAVGERLLAIDPDGNVMPCHRFLYRPKQWLGHLAQPLDHDKRSIYTDLTSAHIDNDCGRCSARSICGGGCRVVAMQAGGGLYGTHPFHCLITRAHARAVERIYAYLASAAASNQTFAPPAAPDLPEGLLESSI